MNVHLDELLARGVPDELTTRERVEAAFICSRAIAQLDHWLAALEERRVTTRHRSRRRPNGGRARRFDPYRNFKFRLFWAGSATPVAGASKMSALKRSTEAVKRGGAAGREPPGRTKYAAITLEHGITHDREFEQWANKVWNYGAGPSAADALKGVRRNIVIEVLNEAGRPAVSYKIHSCWVSEFQAMPDLDANANAVAIQHLKLENEGWERVEGDRS